MHSRRYGRAGLGCRRETRPSVSTDVSTVPPSPMPNGLTRPGIRGVGVREDGRRRECARHGRQEERPQQHRSKHGWPVRSRPADGQALPHPHSCDPGVVWPALLALPARCTRRASNRERPFGLCDRPVRQLERAYVGDARPPRLHERDRVGERQCRRALLHVLRSRRSARGSCPALQWRYAVAPASTWRCTRSTITGRRSARNSNSPSGIGTCSNAMPASR